MASKTWTVYVAMSALGRGAYVGVTSLGMKRRMQLHRSNAAQGFVCNFHDEVRENGVDTFLVSTHGKYESKSDAFAAETSTILKMRGNGIRMLNMKDGHGAPKGHLLGRTIGHETRAKMSASRTGTKSPRYNHNIYTFVHDIHGEEVCTQHELRSKYNLGHSNLSSVCSGKLVSYRGWKIKPQQ